MRTTVRAVTLNLWGEQPPLERRMELATVGLRALDPDVIALQEVRTIPGSLPNQAETLAGRLGREVAYACATPGAGGEEGLAILSRWPIVHTADLELPHATEQERRIVLGVAVAAPQGELSLFVTHLNYRLADGVKREDQVEAIDRFVQSRRKERTSALPSLLLGDFNATAEHDEIRFLRGQHTLSGRRTFYQDAWAHLHNKEEGYTWARCNPHTAKLHWLDLNRRIDYIFVTPVSRDGRGQIRDCRLVFDQPAQDGCYVSDHFGLLAEIELAPAAP